MLSLGSVIRQERDILGISQGELAARTNGQVSQTYISALERGVACNISFGKLQVLASALGISISTLLANTEKSDDRRGAGESASTAA